MSRIERGKEEELQKMRERVRDEEKTTEVTAVFWIQLRSDIKRSDFYSLYWQKYETIGTRERKKKA